MTGPRTLTTDHIRDLYSWACAWRTEDDATEGESDLSGMRTSQRAEFDRWLAAHEAEVVGQILDRIDALHAKSTTRVYTERECQDGICDDHYDPISGAIYCPSYLLDVCRECSHYCCDDGDHDEPFPCPTRRLTAEIRGEMSHD